MEKDRFYYDEKFLGSMSGRPLRILSEYLGPLSTLQRNQIKDTIVFFGGEKIYGGAGSDVFVLSSDLGMYSSSYSANSSSRDFFLGCVGLPLRGFGVSSIDSLDVPHEPQNFAVELILCPQLSQNAIFTKYIFDYHTNKSDHGNFL